MGTTRWLRSTTRTCASSAGIHTYRKAVQMDVVPFVCMPVVTWLGTDALGTGSNIVSNAPVEIQRHVSLITPPQSDIGSCPYWNHPLPSHTTITQPGIRLLFRICQTHWFSFQEDGLAHTINGLGIQTEHYGNRLRNGTMTIKDGFRLLAETLLAHMIMCLQIVIFSLIVELWPLLGSMWRYGVDGSWKFTSTGFPSFVLSVMITNFVAFGMVVILLLMVMVRKEWG